MSDLEALRARWAGCTACGLCATRTQVVFGTSYTADPLPNDPLVLVIGGAPGRRDDREGDPFTGAAGDFLRDEYLATAGVRMAYLANVLGCYPPEGRDPRPAEMNACADRLTELVEVLKPDAVLLVGKFAERVADSSPWGAEIPKVAVVTPLELVKAGHPSVATEKTLKSQIAKMRQLLKRAAGRALAAPVAGATAGPSTCTHPSATALLWRQIGGPGGTVVTDACGVCGHMRQSAPGGRGTTPRRSKT